MARWSLFTGALKTQKSERLLQMRVYWLAIMLINWRCGAQNLGVYKTTGPRDLVSGPTATRSFFAIPLENGTSDDFADPSCTLSPVGHQFTSVALQLVYIIV